MEWIDKDEGHEPACMILTPVEVLPVKDSLETSG